MPRALELSGRRFGRLVVSKRAGSKRGHSLWLCMCDCGASKLVDGPYLTSEKIRSCGCLSREVAKTASLKHGKTNSTEHNIWMQIRDRCSRPSHPRFADYGGRGIKMCARWERFENFFADMGPRPPGLSLDRIDNDGPYSPENCRWATRVEQANNTRLNRRIECNGTILTEAQWSKLRGIKRPTLQYRLNAGWSPEEALGFTTRPQAERYRAKCKLTK